jgi:tetratricopeptide (TPR) repeat protein
MVPRRVQVVTVVAVVVGAVLGIVTNYATAELPSWLSDPGVRWLVLALLVALAIIAALLLNSTPTPAAPPPQVPPDYGANAGSLAPPAADSYPLRGRDRELRHLGELVARPKNRFAVITGAGGMGKTALAQEVVEQARRDGYTVAWLRWLSPEQLTGRMLEAASRLGIPPARIGAAQQSGASLVDLVWNHLNRTRRWVIVIDNLDQPGAAAPAGEQLREYRGWIRPSGAGLLIVTSRDRNPGTWGPDAEFLVLDSLDTTTAAQVLRDTIGNRSEPGLADGAGAVELAARLGGLPLALHAAAAAIAAPTSRHPTFAAYTAALADRTARLLPEPPDTTNPDTVRRLVGHTWEISLDQLADEGHPIARPLLRLLALYADAPIPRALITAALFTPTVHRSAQLPPPAGAGEADGRGRDGAGVVKDDVIDAALAGLHRYGLLEAPDPSRSGGIRTVLLHPVVRDAATELLTAATDPAPWRHATEAAIIRLINQLTAENHADKDTARLLTPHALILTGLHSTDRHTFAAARHVIDKLADLLFDAGLHRDELQLRQAVLDAVTSCLGADHPETLISRHNLAASVHQLGHHQQAAELHQRNLTDRERVLGPNHPDTVRSRSNLGSALDDLGRHQDAADLLQRTVVDCERVLGANDPDTLDCRNHLGLALFWLCRYQEAADLHQRTLTDREHVLGADHRDTLRSRNNLAAALQLLGRYQEAAELHQRTLTDRERVLGADHPDNVRSRNSLASALHELGQHQQAVDLFQRAVSDGERVLGASHPDTLTIRNNLAETLAELGRYREAADLFQRALIDRERVLGLDDPYTLQSRFGFAVALFALGHYREAADLLQRNVTECERVLGPDHPNTAANREIFQEVRWVLAAPWRRWRRLLRR